MSFPVPVEYGLNDSLDTTEVIYNNGAILPGLPSVPGVRPDNIMLYQEFTLAEDHDSANKITLNVRPAANCLILLVCLSPMTTPDEEHNIVPWYALETHGANVGRYGRNLNTAGSLVGQGTYGNFFEYASDDKILFPSSAGYHLIAGQKYAFYQIKLADVNAG